MVTAVFAFLGTELVGVTVGEAQNPRKTIPRAIKLTFYRILVFYVCSILLVGMLVPFNSKELAFANKASTSAAASPFVVAITLSGIPVLPGFLNACFLLFVVSAANSDLYIATRTIYGLAREKKAPAFLAKTNKSGVPVYALAASGIFCLLAYLNVSDDSKVVFTYFVNLVSMFGLLTWISILVSRKSHPLPRPHPANPTPRHLLHPRPRRPGHPRQLAPLPRAPRHLGLVRRARLLLPDRADQELRRLRLQQRHLLRLQEPHHGLPRHPAVPDHDRGVESRDAQ